MVDGPRTVGKYTIVRRLGAGGMAELLLARAVGPAGFSKEVALKKILPNHAGDRDFVEMFLDEARIAARLNHPNIVQIYDLGESDGVYFIAMEYVHGFNVYELLREAARRGERVPIDVALGIVLAASEGLGFAHAQRGEDGQPLGLVHRDVSPHNILVSYEGAVKVCDFGIARAAGRLHHTEHGGVKGKLSYMSPEQALGQAIDRRADIYSLGVVLHELLTTRRLFGGGVNPRLADPKARVDVPRPSEFAPGLPNALDAITMRALAFHANERYATCEALRDDLERAALALGAPTSAARRASLLTAWFPERAAGGGAADTTFDDGQMPTRTPSSLSSTSPGRVVPPFDAELTPTPTPQRTRITTAPEARTASGASARRGSSRGRRGTWARAWSMIAADARTVSARAAVWLGRGARAVRARPAYAAAGGAALLAVVVAIAWLAGGGGGSAPTRSGQPRVAHVPVPSASEVAPPADEPGPSGRAPSGGEPTPEPAPEGMPSARAASTRGERDGTLNLDVTPSVNVFANGHALGHTPLRGVRLPAGRHRLRLIDRAAGIDTTVDVEVPRGRGVDKHVTIGKGRLRIKALPWADVTVDGRELGTTPMAPLSLYAGTHEVRLSYHPQGAPPKERVERVTLAAGADELLERDLRK
jgi:eukaryotic-like serine/threonine-protein kinase